MSNIKNRINELRFELTQLELQQRKDHESLLMRRVDDLDRDDMIILRDLLDKRIKETYDGDDE